MSGDLLAPTQLIELREFNKQLPIATLPPELLSEIFLECIDRGSVSILDPRSSVAAVRRVRTTLASVCHRWRQVARATKTLWAVTSFPNRITKILSDGETSSYIIPPAAYESFQYELELLGGASISLISQITCDDLELSSLMPTLEHDLRNMLSPVLSRCGQVLLEAPREVSVSLLTAFPEKLSNIKSLDIRAWGEYSDHGNADLKTLDLSHANTIQKLSINFFGRYPSWGLLPTANPRLGSADNLKNLTILGYVNPSAAYGIVSRARSLHSLTWPSIDGLPDFIFPPGQISMQFLRYIALGEIGPVSLFSHLDAPNTRSVVLKDSLQRVNPTPFPFPSRFIHLRSLILESTMYTLSPLLPPLVLEFRALEVLIMRGVMSMELASACTGATNLRLVAATWVSTTPSKWLGSQRLLDHWSDRIHIQDIAPLSCGFCFVYHVDPSEAERRTFIQSFPTKYPDIKIGLRSSHPLASWQPEDWDGFFTRVDTNPSYLPTF
ncbi:hypothetical protein DL93DRAFT_1764632 [Clavulina sp. PMI_390]|nr:hypothetical protein DL93DRAFT_1764632 [Clavulina sp. PMI_390]